MHHARKTNSPCTQNRFTVRANSIHGARKFAIPLAQNQYTTMRTNSLHAARKITTCYANFTISGAQNHDIMRAVSRHPERKFTTPCAQFQGIMRAAPRHHARNLMTSFTTPCRHFTTSCAPSRDIMRASRNRRPASPPYHARNSTAPFVQSQDTMHVN